MIKAWLNTFVDEKELNRDFIFEMEGASGTNFIPLQVVIEHIEIAPKIEQLKIKKVLVILDFKNADVMDFFKHLAGALAI